MKKEKSKITLTGLLGKLKIGDTIVSESTGIEAEITEIPNNFEIEIEFDTSDYEVGKIYEFFYKGGDVMPKIDLYGASGRSSLIVFGKHVSHKVMSHTSMRFNTMTERQLWTRMGKITNEEKLLAFAAVAEIRNKPDLSMAAIARYVRLTGDNSVMNNPFKQAKSEPKKNEKTDRLLRKLDI